MATTRLTDVIYSPLFLPYAQQRTAELSLLRSSGIASDDAQIQAFANGPGNIVEMPFWDDISGDSNVSSDDPASPATPNKMNQGQDKGRKIRRNNGWQTANLVTSLTGEDPIQIVGNLIAAYWAREEQKILLHQINGVFADPLMAGNVLDVASEDADASGINFDVEVAADAYSLVGEYSGNLTAQLMHSTIYHNLEAQRAITYKKDPVTGLDFGSYNGRRVIVSDQCPRVAGTTSGYKYTSYLFGNGAFAYAEATGQGGPKKPVELASDASAGDGEGIETLWYRRHWVMHPRGVAFDGDPAGESPTNAELADGTNWTRVYDPKLLRMVSVTTNG